MRSSLHEDLSRPDEVKGSSERGFGLTVGGILLLIGAVRTWPDGYGWVEVALAVMGLSLIVLGSAAPRSLIRLNRGWTKLGVVLFKVVNPIVLGLIYLTPIGLVMRALGRDPFRLKPDSSAPTYWAI